ncbi:phosphate ABC transporter substrate-binding protein PstS [Undibacterium sp.]|jgi:phosphate transport system substrate-binding protein|uniref:phosphate ABC transporter substrate-binding protein PstS n=1 Tax=Undibacterium sp. TaxID=1914977 RepID=UPI002C7F1C18|nr:phosphate ABC transporter substrate-binding protein PstS [Undibacterium sp.]HTD02686.1 phosphate ABC transporter substrate-binding protein PstS [Undibacterium sp.]
MSRLLPFVMLCSFAVGSLHAATVTGAGSSAAAPLYEKWAAAYGKKTGLSLDYQAAGSAAGIRQIKARSVDFGASDVAMTVADLRQEKLIQFPSAISGVVPVVNLPGVKAGELKLTGEALADIFSRKIGFWDDATIATLNPALRLPHKAITVIVRQDGSGTTYNFTDYLSKVSAGWQAGYGKNFTIKWQDDVVQLKGSGAVSAGVKKTAYAISYIDYNYVLQDKLDYATLKNRDGKFLPPSAAAFEAALNNSGWKSRGSFEEMLTDKPGSNTWPITMGTFVIMPQNAANPEKAIAALKFFTWSFMSGDHLVSSVDLVRLPDSIQARIFKEMTTVADVSGKPLKWAPQ